MNKKKTAFILGLLILGIQSTSAAENKAEDTTTSKLQNFDEQNSTKYAKAAISYIKSIHDAKLSDLKIKFDLEMADITFETDKILTKKGNLSENDKNLIKHYFNKKQKAASSFTKELKKIKKSTNNFFSTIEDSSGAINDLKEATQKYGDELLLAQESTIRDIKKFEGKLRKKGIKIKSKSGRHLSEIIDSRNREIAKIRKQFSKNSAHNKLTKLSSGKISKAITTLGAVGDTYEIVIGGDKLISGTIGVGDVTGPVAAGGGLALLVSSNAALKKTVPVLAVAEGVRVSTSSTAGLLSLAVSDGTYQQKIDRDEKQISGIDFLKVWDNEGKMTPLQMKDLYTSLADDLIHSYRINLINLDKAIKNGDIKDVHLYSGLLEDISIEAKKLQDSSSGYLERVSLPSFLNMNVDPNKIKLIGSIIDLKENGDHEKLKLASLDQALNNALAKKLNPENFKIRPENVRNVIAAVDSYNPNNKNEVKKPITNHDKDLNSWRRVNLMQNQLSAITQGGSSIIGTASYFIGRPPAQDVVNKPSNTAEAIREQRFNVADLKGIREASQYTDGQVLQAPVDILLNWGSRPSDLDSHLTGPVGDGSSTRFHVFYGSRGSLDSAPNARLHSDYINHTPGGANLPEQTRINTLNEGVYRFYVHDFSNRGATNSTALSNSGATVTFHNAGSTSIVEGQGIGEEVARIKVPENTSGNTWQAFELDSRTGILNRTTEFRDVSNPSQVPFND